MSVRVQMTIINKSGTTVKCTDTACKQYNDLHVGDTLENNGQRTYTADTNDRIFCTWQQEAPGAGSWQLGMTCPKSSNNSAQGSYNAGLHTYNREGTPAMFTYTLGQKNEADWGHGSEDKGELIRYGDCS